MCANTIQLRFTSRRWAWVLVVSLLWSLVGLLAAEWMARGITARRWTEAQALQDARMADNTAAMRELLPPEIATLPSFDEQAEAMEKAISADQQAWCNKRVEAMVLCSSDGLVHRAIAPDQDKVLQHFIAALRENENVISQVAAMYSERDMAIALGSIHPWSKMDWLYPQPLMVDGDVRLFQFRWRGLPSATRTGVLFVRQSLWEKWAVRYRPHVTWTDGFEWDEQELPTYQFSTNSLGLRGPEPSHPKPSGSCRILCIGGSTTVEGPTDTHTYPALLQELLCSRFGAGSVEIINAGIHGSGSDGDARRTQELLHLSPDIVVHYNFVNDYRVLATSVEWVGLSFRESPRVWLRRQMRRLHALYLIAPTWLIPGHSERRPSMEYQTFQHLRGLGAQCKKAGAELCFASFAFPRPTDMGPADRLVFDHALYKWNFNTIVTNVDGYAQVAQQYNDLLRDMCNDEAVTYLPLAETMQAKPAHFSDICHMTAEGIALKARCMAELLAGKVEQVLQAKPFAHEGSDR